MESTGDTDTDSPTSSMVLLHLLLLSCGPWLDGITGKALNFEAL